MSKCCKQHYEPCCCEYEGGYGGGSYSNIYSLLILILIVCQFCKGEGKFWGKHDDECDDDEHGLIDNSILFIIAIFILVYCSCGKGFFGGCQY